MAASSGFAASARQSQARPARWSDGLPTEQSRTMPKSRLPSDSESTNARNACTPGFSVGSHSITALATA